MHEDRLFVSVDDLVVFLEADVKSSTLNTSKQYVKKLVASLEKSKKKVLKEKK